MKRFWFRLKIWRYNPITMLRRIGKDFEPFEGIDWETTGKVAEIIWGQR